MGLFDKIRSTKQNNNYENIDANRDLCKELTQAVAVHMYQVGITSQPALSFFNNDRGVFDGLFQQHMTNKDILALKKEPEDTYMLVIGMHAFGAGAYVTAKQLDFKKSVSDFTYFDVQTIANDFLKTDAYELALNRLGIPLNSRNKQVIDSIIITALETHKQNTGKKIYEAQNIKAYMQVLYNAGISMYMLRK